MKRHGSCCHSESLPEECGGNGHEYCKSIIRQCRRESSGHKQSVNKHRKSARGRRKGKGGGYVWARQKEKYMLHLVSSEASAALFSSGHETSKSLWGHKHQHLQPPSTPPQAAPHAFFFSISHLLYNSVILCPPFIHSYYGSPFKQSSFTAGFSSCLTAFLHNTVLIHVSTIIKKKWFTLPGPNGQIFVLFFVLFFGPHTAYHNKNNNKIINKRGLYKKDLSLSSIK